MISSVDYQPIRTKRAFEEIVEQVRDFIKDGSLQSGDRFPPERELSMRLNVSRSALREALRTLESSGILELRKGKGGGAFVSNGNPRALSDNMRDLLHLGNISIDQLTEARMWIEEIVVRVACQRATEEDFQALENNILEARTLYEQKRYSEKTDKNIEFHNILARATRNPILVMNVQSVTELLRNFAQRVSYDEATYLGFSERVLIVKAIRAGDEAKAVKKMLAMMRKWHQSYVGMAKGPSITGNGSR